MIRRRIKRLAWAVVELGERAQDRAMDIALDPMEPRWRRRWALRWCGFYGWPS